MLLKDITSRVNELLAGERHTYNQLIIYLDKTIDDINSQLNSTFPAFSELPEGKAEYAYFPDRFIRSVVCVGAAWYYFTTDEEGISTAPQYQYDYDRGLFIMLRDYFNQVPVEYQSTDLKALVMAKDIEDGERGVSVDGYSILP